MRSHVERLRAEGVSQKVIALSLDCVPNYISQLKDGKDVLPLARVLAFASAAHLSEEERKELLHTRLLELHGEKGQLCVETLAQWAVDLVTPVGDEAKLLAMWRDAASPAPLLVEGLLEDPIRAQRISAVMHAVVQEELAAMAQEAALP